MKSIELREKHNRLYDLYSELLPLKKKSYFADYYINDYSICEIAEKRAVTRQFVSLMLNGAVKSLTQFEKKLQLYSKSEDLKKKIDLILETVGKMKIDGAAKKELTDLLIGLDDKI